MKIQSPITSSSPTVRGKNHHKIFALKDLVLKLIFIDSLLIKIIISIVVTPNDVHYTVYYPLIVFLIDARIC